MRPKKRILLAGADELKLSTLSLVLFTRGYAVETASSLRDAALCLDDPRGWELVLCQWTAPAAAAILHAAHLREIPSLVVAAHAVPETIFAANVLVSPRMPELLECVAILTTRKRGPKPAHARNATIAAEEQLA